MDAISIYRSVTNTDPTRQETLEGFSFDVAKRTGLISRIPGREGLAKFNDKSVTPKQGENMMNAIYTGLNKSLNKFDLTTKKGIKAANSYIQNNFSAIIQQINELLKTKNDEH
jgi:hypothetical protein